MAKSDLLAIRATQAWIRRMDWDQAGRGEPRRKLCLSMRQSGNGLEVMVVVKNKRKAAIFQRTRVLRR